MSPTKKIKHSIEDILKTDYAESTGKKTVPMCSKCRVHRKFVPVKGQFLQLKLKFLVN